MPTDVPLSGTIRSLSPAEISEAATSISRTGFVKLDGFFAPDDISAARRQAISAVSANAGEYLSLTGTDKLTGFILHDLQHSPEFHLLCGRLYQEIIGRRAPPLAFHQVLRCLAGASGRKHANYFHFDSYVLTALAPIAIPDAARGGALIMLPNIRKVRRYYLVNFLEKLLLDRMPVQRLLRALMGRIIMPTRILLDPGAIYFFLGYCSLHTNEAFIGSDLRSTVLFHCIDPHAESRFKALVRSLIEIIPAILS
jgi:hypothetical protein